MKKDIAPGVTSEHMVAEYLNKEVIKEQPKQLYRMDRSGHRYYYSVSEQGEPTFYPSVTTMIKQTMPTSPHLISWMMDRGEKDSKEEAEDRAHYGTLLHILCGKLLIKQSYNLDLLFIDLQDYMEEHRLPPKFEEYEHELKKDILAFAQFAMDVKLEPVAIEIVLSSDWGGYAGAIDIVGYMNVEESGYFGELLKSGPNKGKPKLTKRTSRVLAIVDIKSGRKGFFPSHEIQLHAYKKMWDENFPDLLVEAVFNFSPKAWRGNQPTYNLKNQTGSSHAKKLDHLVAIAKIEDDNKDNTLTITGGTITLGESLYSNVETKTLADIVRGSYDIQESSSSDLS